MIREFLLPQAGRHRMKHFWFQQDGATAHTAKATMKLLRETFNNRIISKNADFAWPPYSPDLTAPDFFLWGYLKSKVYRNAPKTLQELKANIIEEIGRIDGVMLKKVMENAHKRAIECVQAKGGYLRDMIFHS